MTMKPDKLEQVNFIKRRLMEGKKRGEIMTEFMDKYKLQRAAFDKRLAVAREKLQPLVEKNTQKIDEEIETKLLERTQIIKTSINRTIDSMISKLGLTTVQKTQYVRKDIDGNDKVAEKLVTVSALSARELKEIWTVLKTEAGEPTNITQNTNTNIDINEEDIQEFMKLVPKGNAEQNAKIAEALESLAELEG